MDHSTKVQSLLQIAVEYVSNNLNDYDFTDFPDSFIINKIMHHMKNKKRLNSASLRLLLVNAVEHLDLSGVYVTPGTLREIPMACPALRLLSVKDSGYVITDTVMENLARGLPLLQSLNLCACKHITDRTLNALTKRCPKLQHINLSWINSLTEKGIINFVINSANIKHVDIYDYQLSPQGIDTLTEIAVARDIKILNKAIHHPNVTLSDLSSQLNFFSKATR